MKRPFVPISFPLDLVLGVECFDRFSLHLHYGNIMGCQDFKEEIQILDIFSPTSLRSGNTPDLVFLMETRRGILSASFRKVSGSSAPAPSLMDHTRSFNLHPDFSRVPPRPDLSRVLSEIFLE